MEKKSVKKSADNKKQMMAQERSKLTERSKVTSSLSNKSANPQQSVPVLSSKIKNPMNPATKASTQTRAEKKFDPWEIMLYPHMAEKSMSFVDLQNKIVFVVKRGSTKSQIKEAFEKLFEVKVLEVRTENTIEGKKKAFIKLHPDYSAADIATKLGIL